MRSVMIAVLHECHHVPSIYIYVQVQTIHHPSSQTSYITVYEFTRFSGGQILCYAQENISITEPSEISRRGKKELRRTRARARSFFSRSSPVYRHTSQQVVNQTPFSRRTNANKDWQRALRSEVMAGRVESAFDPDSSLYRPFRRPFFFFFFLFLLLLLFLFLPSFTMFLFFTMVKFNERVFEAPSMPDRRGVFYLFGSNAGKSLSAAASISFPLCFSRR